MIKIKSWEGVCIEAGMFIRQNMVKTTCLKSHATPSYVKIYIDDQISNMYFSDYKIKAVRYFLNSRSWVSEGSN